MVRSAIDVVHVGSASRDLAADDPRGWRLGGGVTYGALTTARLGLATAAVVGVDDPASRAAELDTLRSAGVDLHLVQLVEGPVFRNTETPSGRLQTAAAVGRPLVAGTIPDAWRRARAWSMSPVAGELGDDWTDVPDEDAFVAVGWQGMLRELVSGEPVRQRSPARRALLRRADLVGVSQHDVEPVTPIAVLAGLLTTGTRLAITQGARGGLLVEVGTDGAHEVRRYRPTHTDGEVDATGAGDAFLAALVAVALRPSVLGSLRGRMGADLRFAAAAGSLAVEAPGLAGIADLAAIRTRAGREPDRRLVVGSDPAGRVSDGPDD